MFPQISSTHKNVKGAEKLSTFILETYGIDAKVLILNEKYAIKVDNHFSLFTLINKIRRDFDFEVYSKRKEGYILYVLSNEP